MGGVVILSDRCFVLQNLFFVVLMVMLVEPLMLLCHLGNLISNFLFFHIRVHVLLGRHGDLMVSALDSGSGGPGSSCVWGTALFPWARHFTLILPLSTQEYKWVLANLLLGVTLGWTSIPSGGGGGGVEILLVA